MKAMVTGGAGFIGHHLVRGLLARGDDVVVVDDLSTGMRSRLEPVMADIDFVEASILDGAILDEAVASCDVVFHQAAIPSVERSFVEPELVNDVNVGGTINVIMSAARAKVGRVIFAGSSSVYGIPSSLPCVEGMRPAPESPYGVSKLAAEGYLHSLGQQAGVVTVSLRYFNVFGPAQDPSSEYSAVIPRFVTTMLRGERPTINGRGDISRDFTYVDNVITANLLAADGDVPTGTTCNVACGTRSTLDDLVTAIGDAIGRRIEPIIAPPRVGDIPHSYAGIERARELLGYDVMVGFGEGIEQTVEWYRAHPSSPTA